MFTIVKLFGKSPFTPLQIHMEKVVSCVQMIPALFATLQEKDYDTLEKMAKKMSKLEHQADVTKNDIRNHLSKNLFLPINRGDLLEILSIQDGIADVAEDLAIILTFKKLEIPEALSQSLKSFIDKNMETFESTVLVVKDLEKLLETTFGGSEAEKVRALVDEVAFKEHEADLILRDLLKKLYTLEDEMSYGSFSLWQNTLKALASLGDLSEKLANRIRMTLDLK